jgi:DNA modification methylase
MCNNNFLPDIEYLLYFHKGKRIWNNGLRPLDIYRRAYFSSRQEGHAEAGDVHPTMKPIKLIADKLQISSNEGSVVLDLFGGSGSTLIACEQLNRKCYMAELDPHYCDVIINRWETFTGREAVLING